MVYDIASLMIVGHRGEIVYVELASLEPYECQFGARSQKVREFAASQMMDSLDCGLLLAICDTWLECVSINFNVEIKRKSSIKLL